LPSGRRTAFGPLWARIKHGAEDERVFDACRDLARCLEDQGKLKDALEMVKRVEAGDMKRWGPEDPVSIRSKGERQRIEWELKKKPAQERGK